MILISSILGRKIIDMPATHFYSGTKYAVRAILEGFRHEVRLE